MADIHALPTAARPASPAPVPRKPRPKRRSKVFRAPAELVDIANRGCILLEGLFDLVQATIKESRIDDGKVLACAAVLEQAHAINNAISTLLTDTGSIKDAEGYRLRMFGRAVTEVMESRMMSKA